MHNSKGTQKSKYENKEVGNSKMKNILKENPKYFPNEKTYSRKSAFQWWKNQTTVMKNKYILALLFWYVTGKNTTKWWDDNS